MSPLARSETLALPLVAGGGLGYVLYDCCHYALHYGPQKGYLKVLKSKHMDHHYKEWDESYGITTAFWDLVFRTMPTVNSRASVEKALKRKEEQRAGSEGTASNHEEAPHAQQAESKKAQ